MRILFVPTVNDCVDCSEVSLSLPSALSIQYISFGEQFQTLDDSLVEDPILLHETRFAGGLHGF